MGVNIAKQPGADVSSLVVSVEWHGGTGVDLTGILLDRTGTAADACAVVSLDNPRSADGAIEWSDATKGPSGGAAISLDLKRLSADMLEVLVCASTSDGGKRSYFQDSGQSSVTVTDGTTDRELHRWELDDDFPSYN